MALPHHLVLLVRPTSGSARTRQVHCLTVQHSSANETDLRDGLSIRIDLPPVVLPGVMRVLAATKERQPEAEDQRRLHRAHISKTTTRAHLDAPVGSFVGSPHAEFEEEP